MSVIAGVQAANSGIFR
ncbi:TPA: hypothetical protein ACTYSP_004275 [Citrobacter freundii]